MREIKFRIWDEKNGEWLKEFDADTITYYGFHLVGEVMSVQAPPIWAMDEGCVVEQYTGLKDKDGAEIYEGDVLDVQVGSYRAVEFRRGAFWVVPQEGEDAYAHELYYFIDSFKDGNAAKVVGNIHENPELLEEGGIMLL